MDRRIWLWSNLLSLDAPIIASAWQSLLAHRYHIPLRTPGRVALFLAVWAIYIADRLLDVRRPPAGPESARHAFYRRHRVFAAALLGILLVAVLAITAFWLRPAVVENGLVPLGAVVLYLAILNCTRATVAKELVVAFVFTTGTFLVAWTNDPASPLLLLAPAAAFFVLCLANLTAIENWECAELRCGALPAHPSTRALVRAAPLWIPALAVSCLLRSSDPWYLAVGLSAAATALLLLSGRRLPVELRRVLVDAVLLTPWLF